MWVFRALPILFGMVAATLANRFTGISKLSPSSQIMMFVMFGVIG
jgi:hypothetical protein